MTIGHYDYVTISGYYCILVGKPCGGAYNTFTALSRIDVARGPSSERNRNNTLRGESPRGRPARNLPVANGLTVTFCSAVKFLYRKNHGVVVQVRPRFKSMVKT